MAHIFRVAGVAKAGRTAFKQAVLEALFAFNLEFDSSIITFGWENSPKLFITGKKLYAS